ncbi:MAG: succinate dehydrogenase [SAR324 cluster bacterium]|nr:succinate dehydrogenase [SAR324 cluster bacterium]
MAQATNVGGHQSGLAATLRKDNWWFEAAWTGIGFLIFAIYTTWAALQGDHYWHGSYLSPFYSPVFFTDPSAAGAAPEAHAWFGLFPDSLKAIWPSFIPLSPAILILIGPLSFRMTCYYYRKFYYRSYFMTPPACAVGGRPQKYKGETAILVFQNIHRYTLYIALTYIVILYYDAIISFSRDGELGIGVGSVILLINPTLLAFYTCGCHAFRHLVGGQLDCFSCSDSAKSRYGIWQKVSNLNSRHMLWAWVSMIWVGLTDLYVRLVSMGVITDLNTWGS